MAQDILARHDGNAPLPRPPRLFDAVPCRAVRSGVALCSVSQRVVARQRIEQETIPQLVCDPLYLRRYIRSPWRSTLRSGPQSDYPRDDLWLKKVVLDLLPRPYVQLHAALWGLAQSRFDLVFAVIVTIQNAVRCDGLPACVLHNETRASSMVPASPPTDRDVRDCVDRLVAVWTQNPVELPQ